MKIRLVVGLASYFVVGCSSGNGGGSKGSDVAAGTGDDVAGTTTRAECGATPAGEGCVEDAACECGFACHPNLDYCVPSFGAPETPVAGFEADADQQAMCASLDAAGCPLPDCSMVITNALPVNEPNACAAQLTAAFKCGATAKCATDWHPDESPPYLTAVMQEYCAAEAMAAGECLDQACDNPPVSCLDDELSNESKVCELQASACGKKIRGSCLWNEANQRWECVCLPKTNGFILHADTCCAARRHLVDACPLQ